MIEEVVIFVTDRGAAKIAKQMGSVVQRIPPRTMIPQADTQLGLGGELVRYMEGRTMVFEDAPEMDDSRWATMLNARFPRRRWDRWFGSTPSAVYSVVVLSS